MEEVNQSSPKHAGGRPTLYSSELASTICKRIALGKSLRAVCREDDMPDISTIYDWLKSEPEFTKQYESATVERSEAQHEDLNFIGDEAIEYAKTNEDKNVSAVVTAYKLKADNMKWSMSKMKPKKYGDKLDVVSDGEKLQTGVIILPSKNDIEPQQ